MPVSRLIFLFDFISPNAYIAWTQIHSLAARHDVAVEPVAVLFAGLLSANRALGPAEIRNKWRWMVRDIVRKATALGIVLEPPASHPFNPLPALRLACLDMPEPDRVRLIDALFEAVWAGGPGFTDPEVVSARLDRHGFDGPALVRAAGSDPVKTRLRRQTEKAAALQVFGVPTVLAIDAPSFADATKGRLFWGYDDFPYLDAYLAGKDTFDEAVFEAWEAVRPTAVRKIDG